MFTTADFVGLQVFLPDDGPVDYQPRQGADQTDPLGTAVTYSKATFVEAHHDDFSVVKITADLVTGQWLLWNNGESAKPVRWGIITQSNDSTKSSYGTWMIMQVEVLGRDNCYRCHVQKQVGYS